MGEKLHAAKKLPVGIFHPLCDDLVVTEVVLMFQKMKGDHEPGVDSWSSHDRGVSGLELLLECVPVELLGQFYQGMVEVDDGLEFGLKEVWLNGGDRGFWLHGFSQFLEV